MISRKRLIAIGTTIICFAYGIVIILSVVAAVKSHNRAVEVNAINQYAESDTAAFYTRLEIVEEINIQLLSTTLSDEERKNLIEKRDVFEMQMRQEVARIPVGQRTSSMREYND